MCSHWCQIQVTYRDEYEQSRLRKKPLNWDSFSCWVNVSPGTVRKLGTGSVNKAVYSLSIIHILAMCTACGHMQTLSECMFKWLVGSLSCGGPQHCIMITAVWSLKWPCSFFLWKLHFASVLPCLFLINVHSSQHTSIFMTLFKKHHTVAKVNFNLKWSWIQQA